jgi:hypothetical protein
MAAKGFISSYSYVIDGIEGSSARNVPQGKNVKLKLEVGNRSTTTGLITAIIKVNNMGCRETTRNISPGAKFNGECSFNMGTRDVTIDYYAFSGTTADAHESIHLTAGEETCTQVVNVRKKGESQIVLRGVQIAAHPTTTGNVVRGETDGSGNCRLLLVKNKVYNIQIENMSANYECFVCEKRGVTACGSEISFSLSEKGIGACDQDVKVTLKDNSGERVALDWGNGETVYGTSGTVFRHRYTEGKWVTIKATASGYEPASKYLYVCSSTIYLELRKIGAPPPPPAPPTEPPEQEPPPTTGEKWKRDAFMVVWDGNNAIINYEMEKANPTALSDKPNKCRFSYYGVAKRGTKTAEGDMMNSYCADKKYTGSVRTFWSITPGMNIPVDLVMFDGQMKTRNTLDSFTVTIPDKEVPVGDKITVTVGASFDIKKFNTIRCGEVVPFPLPGRSTWIPKPIGYDICKKNIPTTRVVEFTAADGLIVGNHYVFTIPPITGLDQVLNGYVFEFRGTKTWTIQDVTLIHKPICDLFGIPPESPECKDEVGEFIDPVYAYNTIQKIVNHVDMHGTPAEPETLDYVILPFVVAGAFLPIPVGKAGKLLSKMSGGLGKLSNTATKKLWLKTHQKGIHHLTALGDNLNLSTFWDNFKLGKLSTCENILKQADEVAKRAENQAKLLGNEGEWVRGIRAKWKSDPTTLKTKIDDLEKGADGNLFKTFSDDISHHFDDAVKAGDWKKASQIWHSAAMGVDDMMYLEHNLAKYSPEFQRMHNLMRYTNEDFIKLLKTEKAVVPEFANRFDEGVDYIIRHIGEETGQEVGAYKVILDALPESEVSAIVRNLSGAGKRAAAAITHVLKADATKGMGAFYSAAAKGIEKGAKLSRKEQKAVAAALRTKIDDAAKTMTPKEIATMEAVLKTDDPVKHPKLARLWKYIHGAETPQKFRDMPLWKKAALIGGAFFVVDAVWKHMMNFCMALFLGEETIQWAGFGGIVLNSLTYDWDEKPLSERIKLIEVFTEFKEARETIHDAVVKGSTIFETLCLPFAHIYQNFWDADTISIDALGTKIEYMEKGIDPLSGIGECTLIAQADKKGVAFYVHGETQKYYSGGAFSKVYIPDVIVREDPYKVVLCAEKDGYVSPLMQFIRITEDDLAAKISTPLFNMVPDTEAGPNPFDGRPYTDAEYNALATKPEVVRRGKIICSTAPTGAKIYLDGVYKNALTNWTLEYVPIGKHTVVFKKDGYADCTVNVTVAVEPDAQAYCQFEGTEGAISFKCAHNDQSYCPRGADIFYRKKGTAAWVTFGKKTSSYAVTKGNLEAGVYEVKYNLLNVMECQGEVTVKAGETVDFDKQLRSILKGTIKTKVTAIIDGDGIRTAYTDDTDDFPIPATGYEHQEIRLVGYNAPECEDYPTICAPGGKEAGDRLKELIPVGTEIDLRIFEWEPLGANNRIIAGVFKNGKDVVKEMLRSGLVYITTEKAYRDAYSWIRWTGKDSYEAAWCNPDETNVTISTYDVYGESYNVDVILFDNEIKSSAEGGVTIKKVTPGRHEIEIQDDMLKGEGLESLYSYVEPLNKSFRPCKFEIDVRPGETYRVKVYLGTKAGVPVENAREITFSTSPSSAIIQVDGIMYTHPVGVPAQIPITMDERHTIAFLATDYEPLNAEINVTPDGFSCLTSSVCGYKPKKPYILVTTDYVRAYLKSRVTASSFLYWMQMKGGGEGIGLDEIIDIVQGYKGKKDIGFPPTLDNLIDVVRYYKQNRP